MESNFGSAIGSLFVFILWVVFLNFFLSVIWLGFVVLPMAVYFPYQELQQRFSFRNLLDGKGVLENLWLFMGSFKDKVSSYHLGLVCLLTCLATYFGSFFVILGRILIGGGCSAIVYLVVFLSFDDIVSQTGTGPKSDFLQVYGTTIIFSLINSLVPVCIQQLPKMDNYTTGKQELNVTLFRVFFLRMANLFALIASLFDTVTKVPHYLK